MKNVADIYPLTSAQAGILFHTLEAPESGVYLEQYICTLSGCLDIAAFEQAWQRVVNRYPVLRTVFIWEGVDEPLQVVRQTVELPFTHEDWRDSASAEQQDRLEIFLRQDRIRGFNPANAPLLRLALFQIETDVHQMVWSFHHLQLDGWSTALVLKEVFDCYEVLHRGEAPKSNGTLGAFKDYVSWLKQQDIHQAEAFWKKELAGFTAPTALRVDRGATAKKSMGSYGQRQAKLSEQVTATLQQLAQQHRLTLNTIIQGAWAILLSRYSGERNVLFGATVSGRPAELPGVESMIGMFINTLPVRIQVEPDVELLPWLKAIQSHQLELRRYEYSPLAKIQAWSDIPKGQSLFETIVVFENYPMDGSAFQNENPSLHVDNVRYREQSNYPLSVLVVPGRQLQLYVIYNRSYYDDDVITRLLGHLATVLGGIAANAAQLVGAIPLLTPAEQHQFRHRWNNTRLDFSQPPLIQQFIEQHVAQNPAAVAVVDNAAQLTYRELDRRANQLAHYLQKLGVKPNTPVGLVLERSTEMIVAIMGVLKAGGAYLPLDPTYPRERLAFMLADTQAPVVVVQKKLAGSLPQHDAQTVFIDAEWDVISQEDSAAPHIAIVPDNLAYVIYTSGSTGKPKGVPISHRNLVHSTSARIQYYQKPVERFLLLSSYSFDSSVVGLFWPLCTGGRLILPEEGLQRDPQAIARLICQSQITHLLGLPSLYAYILAEAGQYDLSSLQTVIVAGEACPTALVESHRTILPQTALFNEYGPTEGTVWCSVYDCGVEPLGATVPIGRPIANTQLYILDDQLQPVPIGVPGELYIGGDGLARGYLNQPERTAESFIPSPFQGESNSRLYKTGDLARYLPDGNIQFLGRVDHQVKIRGYRVELEEIELALNQHPQIHENVVVAWESERGQQLVAYFVPASNLVPSTEELRSFLQPKLPDYMLPAAFISFDTLPVTPNGKVDRQSLPRPDQLDESAQDAFVAPETDTEATIAQIWQELLGLNRLGKHENFFNLGGHSLLVMQLVARLRNVFQVQLPVNTVFEKPTLAGIAEHIETLLWAKHTNQQPTKAKSDSEREEFEI